jgi:hypothetical protein
MSVKALTIAALLSALALVTNPATALTHTASQAACMALDSDGANARAVGGVTTVIDSDGG